ncbi:MAG: type 1 glutamine amidotransferase domain-containing protein [Burkholderiales bacterium]
MALVLIPLPSRDFDPTEAALPWAELRRRGHHVRFATPRGQAAAADPRMVEGTGLGLWKPLLRANSDGRAAYASMIEDPEFKQPWSYERAVEQPIDGLVLPGGHAPGMREYLESAAVQSIAAAAFDRQIAVGAICHGVLVAARSKSRSGKSVLFGRRTTALTRSLELMGWALTVAWLGHYYRTYPMTVQAEVTAALAKPSDFEAGPAAVLRDDPEHLDRGFTLRDGTYVSARWPGDAHRFASEYSSLLEENVRG